MQVSGHGSNQVLGTYTQWCVNQLKATKLKSSKTRFKFQFELSLAQLSPSLLHFFLNPSLDFLFKSSMSNRCPLFAKYSTSSPKVISEVGQYSKGFQGYSLEIEPTRFIQKSIHLIFPLCCPISEFLGHLLQYSYYVREALIRKKRKQDLVFSVKLKFK